MASNDYINYTLYQTSNTANTDFGGIQYIPSIAGWMPQLGSVTDPLNRGVPAAPHVETEKEWLRRRVNETLWRAA